MISLEASPMRASPMRASPKWKFTESAIAYYMIMETEDDFSFERKSEMDANNPKVQAWEAFVWKYQQGLPMAKRGEKWVLMKQIFKLTNQ